MRGYPFRNDAEHAVAFRRMLHELTGDADPLGLAIAREIRGIANAFEADMNSYLSDEGLSGPRLGVMMRLLAEENFGNGQLGVSPTHLSECQNVSKNTISALLRGLEDQGLIERTLDPEDRRMFRIRLTDAGHELLRASAADHVAHVNRLSADLDRQERLQLLGLLDKLAASIRRASAEAGATEDRHCPIEALHERFDH